MYYLKFRKTPEQWIQGIPIGNGRLAAMYWGNDSRDILSMNHEHLWRGKYRGKEADCVADKLPLLRELLRKRDYFRATVYANTFFAGRGGDSGAQPARIDAYQPAGNLVFTYLQPNKSYECGLNMENALASVQREGQILGEFFCDSKDGCIMARWKSGKKMDARISFERIEDPEAQCRVEYTMEGIEFTCRFICGIEYKVKVRLKTDADLTIQENGIMLKNASEVICSVNIILTEEDEREQKTDFDSVREAHSEKFSSYMKRMRFELNIPEENRYTEERIRSVRAGLQDDKLQELYFHYGRYLMISSCICALLPPNLQGKWNSELLPPWDSDYHFDINLQMNEWMIESANLSEFAEELADFLLSFLESGRKAARNLYGCRGIWLPLASDVWAECTSESFGYSVWVGAAAWMAQPLWQHYIHTGDLSYLCKKAYPFFREVALFYVDFLEEDENGILQIMPSQSPENRFAGAGTVATVGTCSSSAIDVQLAYDAFGYAIKSAHILGVDKQEAKNWEMMQSKLPPFAVGSDGRLLEWNEEFEEEQPGHKHLSHLYGLFPSNLFTPEKRRKEYEAAVKSFAYRMANNSGYTGWSRAWIANIYARIGDRDKFYEHLSSLLRDFATDSLLDIHPDPVRPGIDPDIFQIDGNFGYVSAVMEALCSYYDDKAHILRALPRSWKEGRLSGLKLPGGHELDICWKNGRAERIEVTVGFSGSLTLVIEGKEITASGTCGEKIQIVV